MSARAPSADRLRDAQFALTDLIGTSDLKPGDRLPAERALMDALCFGRSTIREAMRQLQALRVVETRKGSGSYLLRSVSPSTVHVPLAYDTQNVRDALLQTLDVRRGLEVEAGALAAVRATTSDLRTMADKLAAMEDVHSRHGTAGREDLAFHLSIYDATHNPLFPQLLAQMREAFERFFEKPFDRPDFAARSFPFHRELFDAIAAGDPRSARNKTNSILDIVEEDIRVMST